MNENNEFNPNENAMSEEELKERRESRKAFSLIGLSLALPLLLIVGLRVLSFYFCPAFNDTDVLIQSLFSLILYLAFIPLGWLILRYVPKASGKIANNGNAGFGLFIILLSVCVELAIVGMYLGNMADAAVSAASGSEVIDLDYVGASPLGMGLYFLLILLIVPVVEEFFFRKALLDILKTWGSRPAILLSAFFYAAFHGNLTQFFYSFGLGLVLSYAYLRTGKLRYPLLIHFVFNLLFSAIPIASEVFLCPAETVSQLQEAVETWIMSLYADYGTLQAVLTENPGIIPAYAVNAVISMITLGLAIGGAAVLFFSKNRVRRFRGDRRLRGKDIGDRVFMAPGIMLFLLCSIILTVLSVYNI